VLSWTDPPLPIIFLEKFCRNGDQFCFFPHEKGRSSGGNGLGRGHTGSSDKVFLDSIKWPITIVPGQSHHIVWRGYGKRRLFFQDGDYGKFLRLLKGYARRATLIIHAYCIMPNHIHLIGIPVRIDSLQMALGPLARNYDVYVRSRLSLRRPLWHKSVHANPLTRRYFWLAVRYVEQNPLRVGLVEKAEEYLWSSARAHCGLGCDPILPEDQKFTHRFYEWRSWLRGNVTPAQRTEWAPY